MPSFDITSEVDAQEIRNARGGRYTFRIEATGVGSPNALFLSSFRW